MPTTSTHTPYTNACHAIAAAVTAAAAAIAFAGDVDVAAVVVFVGIIVGGANVTVDDIFRTQLYTHNTLQLHIPKLLEQNNNMFMNMYLHTVVRRERKHTTETLIHTITHADMHMLDIHNVHSTAQCTQHTQLE